jgi:hypothetical protein
MGQLHHVPKNRQENAMLQFVRSCAVLALTIMVLGCASLPRATSVAMADSVAQVANAGLPVLAKAYQDALTEAIVLAARSEDAAAQAERRPSNRGPAMDAAQAKVDVAWAPAWAAWSVFRAAQATWAATLEAGGDGADEARSAQAAYCALAALLPASARSILTADGVLCTVPHDPGAPAAPTTGSK